MKKGGCVYIITNKSNKVLNTGSTTELRGRIWDHITKVNKSCFTARYNCNKIIWYEVLPTIMEAREREYQIKSYSRAYKIQLIQRLNPLYKNLWEDIQDL